MHLIQHTNTWQPLKQSQDGVREDDGVCVMLGDVRALGLTTILLFVALSTLLLSLTLSSVILIYEQSTYKHGHNLT
jgi:hypothetical protein